MKVVFLIPGSGAGFYCENCMRDIPLINEMKKIGTDIINVPIYLPLFTDEKKMIKDNGIFLGAVNLFLKYKFPKLKKMPAWISKLLNSRPLLKLTAKFSSSTQAKGLEGLTLDMITGNMPYLEKEISRLIEFLEETVKPDIIHLSNILLLGLGKTLKQRLHLKGLNTRLVCTLQDEDVWLDNMDSPFREQAWNLLSENSKQVDHFYPVSDYYSKFMTGKLGIKKGKQTTIPNGVLPGNYNSISPSFEPQVIGYLSRLHRNFGLDLLADAFVKLKTEKQFTNLKLRITGGHTSEDHKFIKEVKRKLKQFIRNGDVKFIKEFSLRKRQQFLNGMTVLSVPMEQPEAFGMYLLEAMAAGVPVIEPDMGSFSEIVKKNSGVLYHSDKSSALYEALKSLLENKNKWETISEKARQRVEEKYNLSAIAGELKESYDTIKTG